MLFKNPSWQGRKISLFAVLLGLLASAVATPVIAASVVLNWSDTSTNETGFKIERMPSGGSYSQIATVGSNVQTYTDTNVVAGASYCYRVSAYNSAGTSAPSNSACAQVPSSGTTAPTAPLSLIASAIATPASVAMNWSDTSIDETGFKIERMPSGGSYSLIATVGSNVQTYTDTNVVAGASYCYRVSAYNSAGASAPSNSACAQVPSSGTGTTAGTSTTSKVSYVGGKWKNYNLSLAMKPASSGDTGVMFRYLDSDNYYRLVWDADNSTFRLELRQNGALKELSRRGGNGYVKAGKFYPLQVSANGSQLVVNFNGRQIFSVADATLTEGSVALYTSLSAGSGFDNVVVSELSSGKILLQDDFQAGKISGWTIIDEAANGSSAWSVSNQQLVQASAIGSNSGGDSFGTFALYSKGSWTDYQLALTMKSTDNDTIGAMFRFQDDQNYYRFSWSNEGGFRRLEKRVNGMFTTLAADTQVYTIGQNYQVTILAQGTKLQVSIDGQPVFSVIDSALSGGTVALYTHLNTGAHFDNFMVEDFTGRILLWDDFNDGNFNGWTILDETMTNGPSVWTVDNGALVQSSNIGAGDTARSGTIALY